MAKGWVVVDVQVSVSSLYHIFPLSQVTLLNKRIYGPEATEFLIFD